MRFVKPFTKKTKFEFGKYKGKTVGTVMKTDTNYVIWCTENIEGFSVNKTVQDDIENFKQVKAQRAAERRAAAEPDYDDPMEYEEFGQI